MVTRTLLDTSTLVSVERGEGELDELVRDDDEPAIAAITVAELGVGVDLATGRRQQRRRAFLDALVEAVPIVAYDLAVADAHRALLGAVRQAGRPRGAHDLIIAASARATGRVVVTRDRPGFVDLPDVLVRAPG